MGGKIIQWVLSSTKQKFASEADHDETVLFHSLPITFPSCPFAFSTTFSEGIRTKGYFVQIQATGNANINTSLYEFDTETGGTWSIKNSYIDLGSTHIIGIGC